MELDEGIIIIQMHQQEDRSLPLSHITPISGKPPINTDQNCQGQTKGTESRHNLFIIQMQITNSRLVRDPKLHQTKPPH